jgi:hypothetical protein
MSLKISKGTQNPYIEGGQTDNTMANRKKMVIGTTSLIQGGVVSYLSEREKQGPS